MRTLEYTPISEDEYLRLEAQSPIKHEYVNGEMFAMTGGTLRHNTIAGNVARFAAHEDISRDTPCRAFINDVSSSTAPRLSISYYYPDLWSAFCARCAKPDGSELPVTVEVLPCAGCVIQLMSSATSHRSTPPSGQRIFWGRLSRPGLALEVPDAPHAPVSEELVAAQVHPRQERGAGPAAFDAGEGTGPTASISRCAFVGADASVRTAPADLNIGEALQRTGASSARKCGAIQVTGSRAANTPSLSGGGSAAARLAAHQERCRRESARNGGDEA